MKKKLTIPIVDKNVERPECSVTAGGCVNWYKHCGAVCCVGIVTKAEHTNHLPCSHSTCNSTPKRMAYLTSPKDIVQNIHNNTILNSSNLETLKYLSRVE